MNEDERVRVIATNAMKGYTDPDEATWLRERLDAMDAIEALEAAGYYVGRSADMGRGS